MPFPPQHIPFPLCCVIGNCVFSPLCIYLFAEMAHQIEDLRRQLQHQMDQQGGVFVKSEEYEKMQGQLSARVP